MGLSIFFLPFSPLFFFFSHLNLPLYPAFTLITGTTGGYVRFALSPSFSFSPFPPNLLIQVSWGKWPAKVGLKSPFSPLSPLSQVFSFPLFHFPQKINRIALISSATYLFSFPPPPFLPPFFFPFLECKRMIFPYF